MSKLNIEGRNKTMKNDRIAINAILASSAIIGLIYIIELLMILDKRIFTIDNTFQFVRLFELVLAALAIVSCILCYNSTKKKELFILSLMYIILFMDILFGNVDGFISEQVIPNMNNYINRITSLLRISLLVISIFPSNSTMKWIVNNKINSVFLVIIICTSMEILKLYGIQSPQFETVETFKNYNIFLAIIYTIISISYLKKSIVKNDYIYCLISASIFFLIIKAIYAVFTAGDVSLQVRLVSVSITYVSFIVVIVGIVIELLLIVGKNKQLESELNVFKKIVDESRHSCIFIYDEAYNVKYVNNKMKRNFNLPKNPKSEDILKIIYKGKNGVNNEVNKEIDINLLQLGFWKGTVKVDDTGKTYNLSIQKIYLNNETNIVVLFNDVSEIVKIKKDLIEYEKMKNEEQVRREFFANISHELRTPLNIFYSTIQLFDVKCDRDQQGFSDVYKNHRRSLKSNCQRMLRLINNIVDITKIDVGFMKVEFENLDVVSTIEEITMAVVDFAAIKNINVIFDTEVEEHVIKCDRNLLERIMLNLLSNSIKFSKDEGIIEVNINTDSKWVHINVRDNGMGIPISEQGKIFNRFIQGDKSLTRLNEGSGIGLSLVKSAVSLLGGEIYLDSDGKTGTEFEILLPNKICEGEEVKVYSKVDTKKIEIELSDIYELQD